jgi:hypothetical protein
LHPFIRIIKLNLVSSPEDTRGLCCPQWSVVDLLSPLRRAGLQRLEALLLCDIDHEYERNVDVILSRMEIIDPTLEVAFSFVTQLDLDGAIKGTESHVASMLSVLLPPTSTLIVKKFAVVSELTLRSESYSTTQYNACNGWISVATTKKAMRVFL